MKISWKKWLSFLKLISYFFSFCSLFKLKIFPFWVYENQFAKRFFIFWTDFLFIFFSLFNLISLFLNKWKSVWKAFIFDFFGENLSWPNNWILAPQTSKNYNRQKLNLLSSRSVLSKVMSILLFLIKSSLHSWFFCHLCGHQLNLTVVLQSLILFRFSFFVFCF